MTQIHNIIENKKNSNIKYALEDTNVERITNIDVNPIHIIRKVEWTLKNNKNPAMDVINVELMKYPPEIV